MKLQSKYIKQLNPQAIQDIEWVPQADGEAGWVIYLNPGWSFWSVGLDAARWVPFDNPSEAKTFYAYKIEN